MVSGWVRVLSGWCEGGEWVGWCEGGEWTGCGWGEGGEGWGEDGKWAGEGGWLEMVLIILKVTMGLLSSFFIGFLRETCSKRS